MTFWAGVPRKRGRSPKIDSFPGLRAEVIDGEPTFFLNMEKHQIVTHTGLTVPPRKSNERSLDASFQKIGDLAKIDVSFHVGKHKKFNRALHKIAFTSVVFFLGAQKVVGTEYDHIREYVCHGGKVRPVIALFRDQHKYEHEISPPYVSDETGYYVMRMLIGGIEFIVDLSPNMEALNSLHFALQNDGQFDGWWSIIPPAGER